MTKDDERRLKEIIFPNKFFEEAIDNGELTQMKKKQQTKTIAKITK